MTMRNVHRADRATLQKPTRLDNGFLRVDAFITRTGVFEYRNVDGSTRREYRPPEEVFHADALASFDRAPVTNDHPRQGFVDARNRRALSVGTTGAVRRSDNFVAASLQIEDADVISAIEAGKQEISCGYTADLEETPGISPDGERYDCIQRNIRGNHVAVVGAGRAGPQVRIRMDNAEMELLPSEAVGQSPHQEKLVKITIDGVEVEVPDIAGAVVQKALNERTAAVTAAKTEASAAAARADAAGEELKKLKQAHADATDPKRFDAAVAEQVKLLETAREVLGAAPKSTSARDIKVEVISKLSPGFKADGKDDVYVQARFDAALEYASSEEGQARRAQTQPIPAGKVHADAVNLDSARAEFEKRNQTMWKPTPAK